MITKKMFEAVAAVLCARCAICERFIRPLGNALGCPVHGIVQTHQPTCDEIVTELADVFAADNPRFNRARFYHACGVEAK